MSTDNNILLASTKMYNLCDPTYLKHVEEVESTYDLPDDKCKLVAGRVAISKSEVNKMAAVVSINALNKLISTNKVLKYIYIYIYIY